MCGLLGGLFVFACTDNVGDPALASVEQEVINGTVDHGHPSVGLIDSRCTATLIGKRTVLTAGHCVTDGDLDHFCNDAGCMPGTAFKHPGNWTDNDVATIVLDDDFFAAHGTVPTRVASSGPRMGDWIVIVGFGCTVWNTSTGSGTKRKGDTRIDEVNPRLYQFDGSNGDARICQGDSGGPSFTSSTSDCQVGVHSHRQDFWHGSDDIDMRVDVFLPWIRGIAGDASVLACNQSICGDGICHAGEQGCDCPPQPGPYCGDGVCNGGETPNTCDADCYCGDGICSAGEFECEDCCSGPGSSCTTSSECCSAPCVFDAEGGFGVCGNAQ